MIKTKLFCAGLCAFGLVVLSGCAVQEKKEAAAAQAMPINCATAPGDLRVLNSEKASTASKIGNGISMVAPIGLVAGLVTGTGKDQIRGDHWGIQQGARRQNRPDQGGLSGGSSRLGSRTTCNGVAGLRRRLLLAE